MPPVTTPTISTPAWTCAVTALERIGLGFRFRVEYGIGPDYQGTMFVALDEHGNEIEHETHRADPSVEFGWPASDLRDTVMSRCRELTLIYIAAREESFGRSRSRGHAHVNLCDWQPRHRRRYS